MRKRILALILSIAMVGTCDSSLTFAQNLNQSTGTEPEIVSEIDMTDAADTIDEIDAADEVIEAEEEPEDGEVLVYENVTAEGEEVP